ncbi:hypothetical protein [Chryseobacterium indoltheticum]|uniref:hypothetical protein n=1 Tax=Chryseobacterium indoltheticum TaxID=254 RepID=UPI003F49487F
MLIAQGGGGVLMTLCVLCPPPPPLAFRFSFLNFFSACNRRNISKRLIYFRIFLIFSWHIYSFLT